MAPHRLSLAAGVLADFMAPDVARAARDSGFTDVGFTVKPWPVETTADIRNVVEAGSLRVLDVEVVRIDVDGNVSEDDWHVLEVGGALGAENVLIISYCDEASKTAAALHALAERAQEYGMRACLEFMRFTKVPTLAVARRIVAEVDHPAVGILIDTLHLARTGETVDVPASLLPYAQFCDGLAQCGDDDEALIRDALDDRAVPGEGELPLERMLATLPAGVPLSLEVRSLALRQQFANPVERAAHLLHGTRNYLKRIGRTYDQ